MPLTTITRQQAARFCAITNLAREHNLVNRCFGSIQTQYRFLKDRWVPRYGEEIDAAFRCMLTTAESDSDSQAFESEADCALTDLNRRGKRGKFYRQYIQKELGLTVE